MALWTILLVVVGLLNSTYADMSINTWDQFLLAKAKANQAGMGYAVPSMKVFWQMTGATLFENFISSIFASIAAFGMAGVLLKAVRGKNEGWFRGSFEGFRYPLELLWLTVQMNIRVFLWGLLLVIPGIIAIYRYRQAWYLKSDHPDWSASKCLSASGEMMRGKKWAAFCLDLSFWWWFLIATVLFVTAKAIDMSLPNWPITPSVFIWMVLLYFGPFVIFYYMTARTVFYKEALAERPEFEKGKEEEACQ